jgi:hypothetical protein
MTKRTKLVKKALKNPSIYTEGELSYFAKWLQERKRLKALKKRAQLEDSTPESNPPVDFH